MCTLIPVAIEEGATVFSILGKAFTGMAFLSMYSITAELAPTTVRQQAISFGSACARVSGMAAPFVGGPMVGCDPLEEI